VKTDLAPTAPVAEPLWKIYVSKLRQRLSDISLVAYRKTSTSPPWRSIFQPFPHSGVLLEVTFS